MRVRLFFILLMMGMAIMPHKVVAEPSALAWQGWDDGIFERAQRENKLVLLNLEAVWCHWCHVMEHETYADPEVQALLNKHYLLIKVDQDSRPDLANRYRDYGWPATIFFGPSGVELAKRAGFIEPAEMKKIITSTAANPTTAESAEEVVRETAAEGALPETMRARLIERHYDAFDPELAGLKVSHKFLDADSIDYSMQQDLLNNSGRDRAMALRTLEANLALVDPVWGGVYQYSTGGQWDRAHFEKIMSTQASNLRLYSIAARRFGEERFFQAASQIRRYLVSFLRGEEGAFYTSQDADAVKGEKATKYFSLDDAARRKIGVPRVDRHIYSRENGWAIAALTWLYSAKGEADVLADATRAYDWIRLNRSLPEGGYRHDAADVSGPYLGDSLAMADASLALYAVTADRKYLHHAVETMSFIDKNFRAPDGGFFTVKALPRSPLAPTIERSENISLCRFANLLSHYTGTEAHKRSAEHAMRVLATERMAFANVTEAGILLCDYELLHAPLHVTVLASKGDPKGASLFSAALKVATSYRRLEWWDRAEGELPNSDVKYPVLPKPAAFLCTNKRCSLPLFEEPMIEATVTRFFKGSAPGK